MALVPRAALQGMDCMDAFPPVKKHKRSQAVPRLNSARPPLLAHLLPHWISSVGKAKSREPICPLTYLPAPGLGLGTPYHGNGEELLNGGCRAQIPKNNQLPRK